MSREMKKVTVYKCKWCGRMFKTPNLHQCKFDPDLKNCMSCKHNAGCRPGEYEEGEFIPPRIICPFHPADDDGGGNNEFPMAKENAQCPHHELLEGYKGSKSFAARRDSVDMGFGTNFDLFYGGRFQGSYEKLEDAEAVVRKIREEIENGHFYDFGDMKIEKRGECKSVFENPIDMSNHGKNERRHEFA